MIATDQLFVTIVLTGWASFMFGVVVARRASRQELAWYRRNAGRLFIRCRQLESEDEAE